MHFDVAALFLCSGSWHITIFRKTNGPWPNEATSIYRLLRAFTIHSTNFFIFQKVLNWIKHTKVTRWSSSVAFFWKREWNRWTLICASLGFCVEHTTLAHVLCKTLHQINQLMHAGCSTQKTKFMSNCALPKFNFNFITSNLVFNKMPMKRSNTVTRLMHVTLFIPKYKIM